MNGRRAGFSLIEVVAAVGILSITVLTAYALIAAIGRGPEIERARRDAETACEIVHGALREECHRFSASGVEEPLQRLAERLGPERWMAVKVSAGAAAMLDDGPASASPNGSVQVRVRPVSGLLQHRPEAGYLALELECFEPDRESALLRRWIALTP